MKKLIMVLSIFAGILFISALFASPTFAYTVKSGDTMTKIAKENNLTLQELAEANPHIHNINLIFAGQTVNTTKPEIKVNLIEEKNFVLKESNIVKKGLPAHISKSDKQDTQVKVKYSDYEIDLLARIVRAEAQSEPFEGKIAVACVILNRVDSPLFPNTIKDVIYAPGQFQPVRNGSINKPADEESIKAVRAALTEHRNFAPGALFFYNPSIATSRWLDSRATTLVVGQHVFKK
ncbi:cell wall hydrolase [Neobacillus sp. FSL H8-0543]|uniref:cell wall hydrolase n=1 Tax=Neobacillus sp. FSL H8-0543 TaxID=2954672 RepID=UPI003158EDCF